MNGMKNAEKMGRQSENYGFLSEIYFIEIYISTILPSYNTASKRLMELK